MGYSRGWAASRRGRAPAWAISSSTTGTRTATSRGSTTAAATSPGRGAVDSATSGSLLHGATCGVTTPSSAYHGTAASCADSASRRPTPRAKTASRPANIRRARGTDSTSATPSIYAAVATTTRAPVGIRRSGPCTAMGRLAIASRAVPTAIAPVLTASFEIALVPRVLGRLSIRHCFCAHLTKDPNTCALPRLMWADLCVEKIRSPTRVGRIHRTHDLKKRRRPVYFARN